MTRRILLQFETSDHCEKRISERTRMAPSEVLDLIHTGRSITLNNPSQHPKGRVYLLIFSHPDDQHFVVIACPGADGIAGSLISVLSLEQFEKSNGLVHQEALERAIRQVQGRSGVERFRKIRQPHQLIRTCKERWVVEVEFLDGELKRQSETFFNPKGDMYKAMSCCQNRPVIHCLLDDVDFLDWFKNKISHKPEIVDRITSINIVKKQDWALESVVEKYETERREVLGRQIPG